MAAVERVQVPNNIVLEGPTRVGRCDGTTTLVPPSLQPLVVLLCLSSERLNRETVLAALWPDVEPVRAKARLSTALWRLRRLLADHEGETSGSAPAAADDLLAHPPTSPSAHRWRLLRDVDFDGVDWLDPATTDLRRSLEQAALIDPGQLAAGCDHPWVDEQRHRLDVASQRALVHLVAANAELGRTERAIELADALVTRDELREDGHRWLMQLHARSGRRVEALRCYEHCRQVLARELGIEPMAETTKLADAIRHHGQAEGRAGSKAGPGTGLTARGAAGGTATAGGRNAPAAPGRGATSPEAAAGDQPVLATVTHLSAHDRLVAVDTLPTAADLEPSLRVDPGTEAVLAAIDRARQALLDVEVALRGHPLEPVLGGSIQAAADGLVAAFDG